MKTFRRIRGVLGTGAVWGATWAVAAFVVFGILFRDLTPDRWLRLVATIAMQWGFAGAGTGATFALLLLVFERRLTIERFSTSRGVFWGMVAGGGYAALHITSVLAHFPVPATVVAISILLGALLGACSAALHLALARRATGESIGSTHAQEGNSSRVASV